MSVIACTVNVTGTKLGMGNHPDAHNYSIQYTVLSHIKIGSAADVSSGNQGMYGFCGRPSGILTLRKSGGFSIKEPESS